MTDWRLGSFIQWFGHMIIIDLGNLSEYCFPTEGDKIFLIKLDGLLSIAWHLDSILLFCGVSIILRIKYFGYPDEILRTIGEMSFSFPLGRVEEPICF